MVRSLPWFLPALACTAIAAVTAHPLMLVPLLLANALGMAAMAHATGFAPSPARTLLRGGVAYLLLQCAYTSVAIALVAWPLAMMQHQPSLPAALLLSAALALALAVLWRLWPAFGLVLLWDEAFAKGARGAGIGSAISRSVGFARHLTGEDRFFTHFLPAAGSLLGLVFGALLLSWLHGVLPNDLRLMALAIYGLVLIPAADLLIVNRTLHAMLCEREVPRRHVVAASGDVAAATVEAPAAPLLSPQETAPGAREDALLAATREGDIERALALLEAGADPDTGAAAGDRDQRPVLTLAALLPDTRLLRALITRGAHLNHMHAGLTALLAATRDSYHGRAEAVMMLLANGADPRIADAEGNTALHGAALSVDPSVAAVLLDAEAPLNAINRRGATPLTSACRAANWRLVEFLLERGADPAPADSEPALLAAAAIADDDPTGVALLLKRKAPVNATDGLGRTALMTAALEGHAAIVAALLKAGARPQLQDRNGTTALMEAARAGASKVLQALIEAGADVDPRDAFGRDALLLACQSPRAQAETVQSLLQAGADPRIAAIDGRSALDQAAAAGRWDLVALLDPETPLPASIEAQTDPDPDADTPAHLAEALRFGHWAVASTFSARMRQWTPDQRAQVLLSLHGAEHTAARQWLYAHGTEIDMVLEDGRHLFDALIEHLPEASDAVTELMGRGSSPAGAGRLARAIARADGQATPLLLDMLARGADPFGADEHGATPLHLAAHQGCLPLVTTLLACGAAPNARDPAGRTPLHLALTGAGSKPAVISALIAHGGDPEAKAPNGETPLGLGLAAGDRALQRWLQWNGAWTLPKRPLRASDLPAAAACGDLAAVTQLLELGFNVDVRDSHGASALLHACGGGHKTIAERLLDAGADANLAAHSGITPLGAAVNARQEALVSLLLAHGARLDGALPGNASILMLAAAQGYPDIVEHLLDAGARLAATDAQGRTALHAAAQYCFDSRDSLRSRRLLDLLLKRGADVNAVTADGQTPLLLLVGAHAGPGDACDATHIGALLPALLDAGARLEQADKRGVTALHACAMHALLAPARILLGRGADRRAADNFQRTPADVARVLGYADVALELGERAMPGAAQSLRHRGQPDFD